jgi:hypothetical protein
MCTTAQYADGVCPQIHTDARSHSFANRPCHRKLRWPAPGSLRRYSLVQKRNRYTNNRISRLMHSDGAPIATAEANAPQRREMPRRPSWAPDARVDGLRPCPRASGRGLHRLRQDPKETIPDAEPSVHLDLFPFQVWGSRGRETGGEDLNRTSPRRHFLYRKSGGGY